MLLKRRKQRSPKYHYPNIGREENLVYIHASTTRSMHLIQLREIEKWQLPPRFLTEILRQGL